MGRYLVSTSMETVSTCAKQAIDDLKYQIRAGSHTDFQVKDLQDGAIHVIDINPEETYHQVLEQPTMDKVRWEKFYNELLWMEHKGELNPDAILEYCKKKFSI